MACLGVRHDERRAALRGVVRLRFRRPFDGQVRSAEEQQVEVELARAPADARPAPERPLELLERREQRRRADLGCPACGDVDRNDGVVEFVLVDDADRGGGVQRRYSTEAGAGEGAEGADGGRHRRGRIADVRPETDVRTNASGQVVPPDR